MPTSNAWAWSVTNLAGAVEAFVVPRQARITRRLNDASTLELVLDSTSAARLGTTARVVRAYRRPIAGGARVVRATGRPMSVNAHAGTDAVEVVTISATDAFGRLARRQVQDTTVYSAEAPRDIVAALVAAQNSRNATGLSVAAAAASGPPRDRTYDPGKSVYDAIVQLAEVDDGFYFRVDPLDAVVFSELVVLYPAPGGESSARFEYGAGTIGNLAGVDADVIPPVNSVRAVGAGDGDDQIRAVVSDAGSIAVFGISDVAISFPDVVVASTLEQHARDYLRPVEERTFRVHVAADIRGADLLVPAPWDDFDVGQTVRLNIRGVSPVLDYTGPALVVSFTVEVDADGREKLVGIDLQTGGAIA